MSKFLPLVFSIFIDVQKGLQVTYNQCSAVLPVATVEYRLTTALCNCMYTYEDVLPVQVCSDPTLVRCNTAFGRMHSLQIDSSLL